MEKELGRITKNPNTDIVLRVDDFNDKRGLTIREFVTGDRYTGFTKSGVRILAGDFKRFKEMVNSIDENEMLESVEPSSPEQKEQNSEQEGLQDY